MTGLSGNLKRKAFLLTVTVHTSLVVTNFISLMLATILERVRSLVNHTTQ